MKIHKQGFVSQIILIAVVVLILGAGAYAYMNRDANNPGPVPEPVLPNTEVPVVSDNQTPQTPSATNTPVTATSTRSGQPAISKTPINIPKAHNSLGFDLIKTIKPTELGKNIFISPASVSLALSMVYNGAKTETKTAMQKTLHMQGLDITTINQESLGLINLLKNPDPKVELAIANSVWARKNVTFVQSFFDTVKNYYNAELAALDFSKPEATNAINSWVNKNTRGKIAKIVDEIPADMVMYLINAVYFKGSWTEEFDKKFTTNRPFTTASNGVKQVPLMRRGDTLPYFETTDFQSVKLTYGKGGRISMSVFLPKESKTLDSFLSTLTPEQWNIWMASYKSKAGDILLPKFKIEYEKQLTSVLSKLGMGIAFQNGADFSGLGPNLKISEVKHKTYVDVNEEGTEAAAVTSVGVVTTSVPIKDERFYMEVNRPFFFTINDDQTKEILFIGVVQNP